MLAIGSAAYDAGQVTVAWSDPQPAQGTTQYIVTVYCATLPYFGNNSPSVAVGRPPTTTFNPGQPDPILETDSYYMEAAAYDGEGNPLARSGPVSLLAWPPADLRIQSTGSSLAAQWTALAGSGVTGYTAQLLQGGQVTESQDPTIPQVSFRTTLQPEAAYQIRVRARGALTTGPWSSVSYAPLVLASADCDAGQVTVTWSDPQPVPGTAQYIITVYCASLPSFGNNSPPVAAGRPLTTTFDPGRPDPLLPANDYYLVAAGYDAEGNLLARSGPVTLLARPPAGQDLYFDGTALIAGWINLATAGITGYTAQLLKNGQPAESRDAAGTPAPFQAAFAAGALYQARVRAVGAKTKGPWSAPALGPFKSAVAYAFDDLGRLRRFSADAKVQVAFAYDDRGNVLTETITLGT